MSPLLSFVALAALQTPIVAETPAQHDARMSWWREARLGMFIHWGLYAIPAGKLGERNRPRRMDSGYGTHPGGGVR